MNKIITILSTILFFTNTLFAQKEKLPDTIYVVSFGSLALIANTEHYTTNVFLVDTDFIFTKKKPEIIYIEYTEHGDEHIIWSRSREIVNGDETLLIYSSDIIEEKLVKNKSGRIYAQIDLHNYIDYTKDKPNSKRFKKILHKYLKKTP